MLKTVRFAFLAELKCLIGQNPASLVSLLIKQGNVGQDLGC